MNFTHYNDQAVTIATDLANSVGFQSGRDYLPDPASVREFLDEHDCSVTGDITEEDVEALHEVRAKLRAAFEAGSEQEAVAILNGLLDENRAHPHITNHDGHAWHLHYTPSDAPVAQRIATIAAMALAVVITDYGMERFGICSADDCADVFIDTSRNRSRRYCADACSSRTNVAAYRARQKQHQH